MTTFVEKELAWEGTQMISQQVDRDQKLLRVAVIGREVDDQEIALAEQRMENYSLDDYHLTVIQGTQSDSLLNLVGQLESSKSDYKQTMLQQSQQIHDLESALARYEGYEQLAVALRPELQVLYPQIRTISLSRTVEVRTDTTLTTPITIVLVGLEPHQHLSDVQTSQLASWLQARTEADSVRVVME